VESSKMIEDIVVHIKYQAEDAPRTCFVVFSSRESHIEVLIDWIESVFRSKQEYQIVRLDEQLKSGDSQYQELTERLSSCSFAIVVLDGFRPNVLFEYGILVGLHKPCMVLIERDANIDIAGYFPPGQLISPSEPSIDMDKHFSDVKDRFYVRYDKNKPKESRALIESQYAKMKKDIRNEFLNVLCPHKGVIVQKELPIHLNVIVDAMNKSTVSQEDLSSVKFARSNIERLAREYHLTLPKKYSWTLAEIYHKAKETETAIEILGSAMTGTKSDVNLYSVKAQIMRDQKDYDGAISALDAAIRLYPESEWLWHNKAICLDSIGRSDEALTSYEKAIAIDPSCQTVFFHYGILQYEKGNFRASYEAFCRAAQNDANGKHTLLWQARSLDKLGRTAEAIPILEALISIDESDADSLFALALMTEDEEKELPILDRVLSIVPRHGGAICSRAAVLSNLGRYEEAMAFLSENKPRCKEIDKCPTILTTIAITESKIGKYPEALKAIEELLELDPKHSIGRSVKAYCLAKSNRAKEGVAILEQLASEGPMSAPSWYDLGCCYAQLKNATESVRCLEKAIDMDPSVAEFVATDRGLDGIRQDPEFLGSFGGPK
jgi:tetratricopeptide (TPR) repeat protein